LRTKQHPLHPSVPSSPSIYLCVCVLETRRRASRPRHPPFLLPFRFSNPPPARSPHASRWRQAAAPLTTPPSPSPAPPSIAGEFTTEQPNCLCKHHTRSLSSLGTPPPLVPPPLRCRRRPTVPRGARGAARSSHRARPSPPSHKHTQLQGAHAHKQVSLPPPHSSLKTPLAASRRPHVCPSSTTTKHQQQSNGQHQERAQGEKETQQQFDCLLALIAGGRARARRPAGSARARLCAVALFDHASAAKGRGGEATGR
jgi:hypothetical protein